MAVVYFKTVFGQGVGKKPDLPYYSQRVLRAVILELRQE